MIEKDQIMSLLLEACPSYRARWAEYIAQPGYERGLVYLDLGDFAHHLVGLFQQGNTVEFSAAFDVIEQLHVEGDSYVREAAIIGALECIQNVAGNSGVDPEQFVPFLGPESAKWWKKLNEFWAGDSNMVTHTLEREAQNEKR